MNDVIVVGDRSSNFAIGVTNSTPANNSQVGMDNFVQCFQWPGTVPAAQTVFVKCATTLPPGRFLVIMGQNPLLPVCELQVYAAGTLPVRNCPVILLQRTLGKRTYGWSVTTFCFGHFESRDRSLGRSPF